MLETLTFFFLNFTDIHKQEFVLSLSRDCGIGLESNTELLQLWGHTNKTEYFAMLDGCDPLEPEMGCYNLTVPQRVTSWKLKPPVGSTTGEKWKLNQVGPIKSVSLWDIHHYGTYITMGHTSLWDMHLYGTRISMGHTSLWDIHLMGHASLWDMHIYGTCMPLQDIFYPWLLLLSSLSVCFLVAMRWIAFSTTHSCDHDVFV